jgi:hypothetical protein
MKQKRNAQQKPRRALFLLALSAYEKKICLQLQLAFIQRSMEYSRAATHLWTRRGKKSSQKVSRDGVQRHKSSKVDAYRFLSISESVWK